MLDSPGGGTHPRFREAAGRRVRRAAAGDPAAGRRPGAGLAAVQAQPPWHRHLRRRQRPSRRLPFWRPGRPHPGDRLRHGRLLLRAGRRGHHRLHRQRRAAGLDRGHGHPDQRGRRGAGRVALLGGRAPCSAPCWPRSAPGPDPGADARPGLGPQLRRGGPRHPSSSWSSWSAAWSRSRGGRGERGHRRPGNHPVAPDAGRPPGHRPRRRPGGPVRRHRAGHAEGMFSANGVRSTLLLACPLAIGRQPDAVHADRRHRPVHGHDGQLRRLCGRQPERAGAAGRARPGLLVGLAVGW